MAGLCHRVLDVWPYCAHKIHPDTKLSEEARRYAEMFLLHGSCHSAQLNGRGLTSAVRRLAGVQKTAK